MLSLKAKLIKCITCKNFLVGKVLIMNQVLFTLMWYVRACWSLNPRMCAQIIWCGIAYGQGRWTKHERKLVGFHHLTNIYKGGLGIIDPKAQAKALLAKLVVHGLMSRTKPWKNLFRRRTNMLQLQGKTCFIMPPNISWLFSEE